MTKGEISPPGDEPWIFLVEDNNADVSLVRHVLNEAGVVSKVMVMTDGDRAMRFLDLCDAAGVRPPELIVLDLNLPKMSGREILLRVKRSPVCKDAPLAVLSSSETNTDKDDSLRLGADRYITKASNLIEFFKIGEALKHMIDSRRNSP